MARPKLQLDEAHLIWMAKRQCTHEEMAASLGCSTDTLTRRFADVLVKWRAIGKTRLRAMQWRRACKGSDHMLIHLGKQYLGQTDKLRAEIGEPGDVFDPVEAYARDPALMDRALQLERDIYDADKALDTESTGEAGVPGLAVPAAHSEAGNGSDETAVQSDDEPAGGGDSSPAR